MFWDFCLEVFLLIWNISLVGSRSTENKICCWVFLNVINHCFLGTPPLLQHKLLLRCLFSPKIWLNMKWSQGTKGSWGSTKWTKFLQPHISSTVGECFTQNIWKQSECQGRTKPGSKLLIKNYVLAWRFKTWSKNDVKNASMKCFINHVLCLHVLKTWNFIRIRSVIVQMCRYCTCVGLAIGIFMSS